MGRFNFNLTDERLEVECLSAAALLARIRDPALTAEELDEIGADADFCVLYTHRDADWRLYPVLRDIQAAVVAHPNMTPALLAERLSLDLRWDSMDATLDGLCRNPALPLLLLEDADLATVIRERHGAKLRTRTDLPDVLRTLLETGPEAGGL